jgi:hypothetical protein
MPKLTLRDLFAVVTIVALALGWWVDRRRLAREDEALIRQLALYWLTVTTDENGNRTVERITVPPPMRGPHVLPRGQ